MNEIQNKFICKIGFWFALVAFIASVGYDVVQILQIVGSVNAPLDAILIYGFALGIPVPFLIAMLALHYSAPNDKKFWTHAALLFTVIYTIYVTLNYVVQLATVIPASLGGTLGEIRILDQTPHSLFWDVDALGYIFLGLATLFASFLFVNQGFERWVKWFFVANAAVTPIIGFVYFYPTFSYTLLLLGTPWIITASGSILVLALFFKKQMNRAIQHTSS
jgi:hypothetical protein